MADTKENILYTALRIFAKNGYAAASVSDIAGELGITKGALYKHYKNKQDIFNSIVERMYQVDVDRAKRYKVPEEIFDKSPSAYRNTAIDNIKVFIKAQFSFWTEDEFASNFRKMLVLEQYKNAEIMELYQKCLVSGPVNYMEDLFREMMEQGILRKTSPGQLALEFYGPFYLLVNISDAAAGRSDASELLAVYVEEFFNKNTTP